MNILFIIFYITFLCPFVLAQEFNDEAQFLYFIDVLINFTVPFLVYVIVDYDTDENGSKIVAFIIRSLSFFVNVGLQQELAFVTSPVKVSNYIKILQHIVTSLVGFGIIGNTFIFILYFKNDIKRQSFNFRLFNSKFEDRLNQLKNKLEESINSKFNKLEKVINSNFDNLKNDVEQKFGDLEKGFKPKFDDLKNYLKTKVDELKKEINSKLKEIDPKFDNLKKFVNSKCDNLQKRIQKTENLIYDGILPPLKLIVEPEDHIQIYDGSHPINLIQIYDGSYPKVTNINNFQPQVPKKVKTLARFKLLIVYTEYIALVLFIIVLGFLLNDLRESITNRFIITLAIPGSLTIIIQFTYLVASKHRGILTSYIEWYEKSNPFMPKNYAYIDLSVEFFIYITVLYLPSLINSFLLQTSDIFNKVFLNLSGLIVTSWVSLMFKAIEREGEKAKEKKKMELKERGKKKKVE